MREGMPSHLRGGQRRFVLSEIEDWFEGGAADGFNIMPPLLPAQLDVFAAEVIPILQRRGLFRTEYEGRTLRENLGLRRRPPSGTWTLPNRPNLPLRRVAVVGGVIVGRDLGVGVGSRRSIQAARHRHLLGSRQGCEVGGVLGLSLDQVVAAGVDRQSGESAHDKKRCGGDREHLAALTS